MSDKQHTVNQSSEQVAVRDEGTSRREPRASPAQSESVRRRSQKAPLSSPLVPSRRKQTAPPSGCCPARQLLRSVKEERVTRTPTKHASCGSRRRLISRTVGLEQPPGTREDTVEDTTVSTPTEKKKLVVQQQRQPSQTFLCSDPDSYISGSES